MIITISKPVQIQRLVKELATAGFTKVVYDAPPTSIEIITNNEAGAHAIYDAHTYVYTADDLAQQARRTTETSAVTGYQTLPAFVKTMTAVEAEAHINTQIFNGQTKAQLDAFIDAQITDITTANVAQINAQLAAIRTMLKAAVGALIGIRDLFIFTSKLLLYIRDLVIRFRQ